jgi:hypothetical protein
MKGSKRQVWNGTKVKTTGGLKKSDYMMNKRGRVVSKKMSAASKKRYHKNGLSKWVKATQRARKELGLKGFVAIKKGTKYYKLAKKYYGN